MKPGYWKLSLSLAKLLHVVCLDSLVVTTSVQFVTQRVVTTRVFIYGGQRSVDKAS